MGKIIVGIIGAGRIGRVHTTNIIHHLSEDMFVKNIADPYLDESWDLLKNIPFKGKNYKVIIEDPEIDAVIICSPAPLHVPMIIEAANAGKHIFCEKPIALDIDLIKKAIEIVKQKGVKLQVGFNRRFDPNFAKIHQTIINGDIGKPHILKITSRDPSPPSIDYIKQSGGLFLDMTIHDFDMARFLIGNDIEEVYATGTVLVNPEIGDQGDIDTAIIQLKFTNGTLGVIDNSRQAVYGYDQRVEVFGSKGSISASNNTPTNTLLSTADGVLSEKPLHFFLERYEDSFVNEMHAFHDCIINDKESPVSGHDALLPVVVGLAAKKSLAENKPIKITY